MYKLLTIVMLTISSQGIFAMDLEQVDPNFSVKNILRSKLWYEGLSLEKKSEDSTGMAAEARIPMPEELAVALEKLES